MVFAVLNGPGDFINAHTAALQGIGINLDPHGVLLGPVDLHLSHTAHRGNPLGEESLAILIERHKEEG